jgi:hypothetical protein
LYVLYLGLFAGTLSGDTLPLQLIYQGKSSLCHPKFTFPTDWDITHSPNHWSNGETMISYLEKVLIPYTMKMKEELDLPLGQKTLVIFDVFRAQITEEFRNKLTSKHFVYATIPPCCTDKLQPMDLSVNKLVKDFMKNKFQIWYSEQVSRQLTSNDNIDDEIDPSKIDLSLKALKPLSAKWLVQTFEHLKSNPTVIKNGFKQAEIVSQ